MPSKAALAALEAAKQKELEKRGSTLSSFEQNTKPFASAKIQSVEDSSSLFNKQVLDAIPKFELSDVSLGKVLGKGGFSTVTEVLRINCVDSSTENDRPARQSRQFISQNATTTEGDSRYCIKALSRNVVADPRLIVQGTIDMAVETMFLSVISHPHIISMHAVGSGGFLEKDYFIVLDRLYETLETRISKWKVQTKRAKSFVNKMKKNSKTIASDLMRIKLSYAYDLMGALEYLHNKKLIYRDLKPENVGFDINDKIVFFDFGLTREVLDKDKVSPTTWKLTGETGSIRYMAPEVSLNKPYGYSADVYSFGIMFWEMLSGFKPFAGYSKNMMSTLVVSKGGRPPVEERWGSSVNEFLNLCWNQDLNKRPTSSNACRTLKCEVALCGDALKNKNGSKQRRRATIM